MTVALGRRDKARREDVRLVKRLITLCIMQHMSRQKVVNKLAQANVDPRFTQIVWKRLEEENQVFFQQYYQRLVLIDQVTEFNRLLEKQLQLMNQMNVNEVASISTVNASHKQPIPEITAYNTVPASNIHQSITSNLPGVDTSYCTSSWHNVPEISAQYTEPLSNMHQPIASSLHCDVVANYGSSSWHDVSQISAPYPQPAYDLHQPIASGLSTVFTEGSSSLHYVPQTSALHSVSPLSIQQSMAFAEPASNLLQPVASGFPSLSNDVSSSLHNDIPTDIQITTHASGFCAPPSMVSTQNSNEGLLLQGSGFPCSSLYMFGAVSCGGLDEAILEPSSPGIGFSDDSSCMFDADSSPQAHPQNGSAPGAASASTP